MDTLNPGGSLGINQQLQSNNGNYILVMQADGNLVLYAGAIAAPNAVWATNTWSLPPQLRPVRADMQQDGNFVLYNATNNPAWASGTQGHPGARLVLQDDQNLVIYDPSNKPLWATNIFRPPSAGPVTATKDDNVGYNKHMHTQATLYRDSLLQVSTFTKNDNWTGGLRGHVLVVPVDAAGYSLWVSQDFRCSTRCSTWDPSCASYGTDLFSDHFPTAVGKYTNHLDVYQADIPSFVDLRNKLIQDIKAAGEVAQEVKDQLGNLF